jgi:hypothetical protein
VNAESRQVVVEELWRSVVWIAIGLFGWSLIVSSTDRIDASALTALGLPLATWAALTLSMIGIRLATGMELKVETESGRYLMWFIGLVVGAFVVLWLILVRSRPWTLAAVYVVGTVVDSASSKAGNATTGSARKIMTVPVTSMNMTSTSIADDSHPDWAPYPVVVNVSTTNWAASRSVFGSPS